MGECKLTYIYCPVIRHWIRIRNVGGLSERTPKTKVGPMTINQEYEFEVASACRGDIFWVFENLCFNHYWKSNQDLSLRTCLWHLPRKIVVQPNRPRKKRQKLIHGRWIFFMVSWHIFYKLHPNMSNMHSCIESL